MMATQFRSLLDPISAYFGPLGYSGITECHTLEFFKHADEPVEFKEGQVDEVSMSNWLDQPRESRLSGQRITQRLRIIFYDLPTYEGADSVIPQTFTENGIMLSITESSASSVIKHFGFPSNCIDVLVELASPACIYPIIKKEDSCSGLLFFNGNTNPSSSRFIKLALKYSPETQVTYGIFLLDTFTLPDLLAWGKPPLTLNEACILPFLLPIHLIEVNIKQGKRGIQGQDSRVNRIQDATGQFVPTENFPLPEIDLGKLDYTDMTRQLNFSGDVTSSHIFLLKSMSAALRVLEKWSTSIVRSHQEEREREIILQDQNVVREKLDYIQTGIDAALMHAEHVQRRTEAFRQLVYQLMAQKDSRTNITIAASSAAIAKASKEDSAVMRQIAIDTKRDSSAMKTIATLTMFFLPGTFIAAIFAMPVFEWGDSRTPVIKNGFKQYWIVTLPLTLVVCLFWAAAILLPWRSWFTSRKEEKSHSKEQDDREIRRSRSCLGYLGWTVGCLCGLILGTRGRRVERGDVERVSDGEALRNEERIKTARNEEHEVA